MEIRTKLNYYNQIKKKKKIEIEKLLRYLCFYLYMQKYRYALSSIKDCS